MKTLITLALAVIVLSGCQLDFQGPSFSSKVFYKGENGGNVYKSRGSGMAGGNAYASNGGRLTATGDGADVHSIGNKTDQMLRNFFRTQPEPKLNARR